MKNRSTKVRVFNWSPRVNIIKRLEVSHTVSLEPPSNQVSKPTPTQKKQHARVEKRQGHEFDARYENKENEER